MTIYYNYTHDGTELEVTCVSYDRMNDGAYVDDIVIPAKVNVAGKSLPVTSIGYAAFRYCSYLTSVSIPENVTSIDMYAFDGCNQLMEVISQIKTPFAIWGKYATTKAFDTQTFENGTLYVPVGTENLYRETEGWQDFTNIQEMGEPTDLNSIEARPLLFRGDEGTVTIEGAPEGAAISIYSTTGMLEGQGVSQKGAATISTGLKSGAVTIVKVGDKVVKVRIAKK